MGPCTGEEAFGELHGVAVDPAGNVWVYQGEGGEANAVDEFSDTGAFIKTFKTGRGAEPGMAVDASGAVYVISGEPSAVRFELCDRRRSRAAPRRGERARARPLHGGPAGGPGEQHRPLWASAAKQLNSDSDLYRGRPLGIHGLAVSSAGTAYASERGADSVVLFDDVLLPGVSTGSASQVSEAGETLNGSVDPEGQAITACSFEYAIYGTEAGVYPRTVACAQTPADLGSGTAQVPVSAEVSGLRVGATYRFRLAAANTNGTGHGSEGSLRGAGYRYRYAGALAARQSGIRVGVSGGQRGGPTCRELRPRPQKTHRRPRRFELRPMAAGGLCGRSSRLGCGRKRQPGNGLYLRQRVSGDASPRRAGRRATSSRRPPRRANLRGVSGFLERSLGGILHSRDQPPLAGAPAHCNALYSHSSDGSFSALFTSTLNPGNVDDRCLPAPRRMARGLSFRPKRR